MGIEAVLFDYSGVLTTGLHLPTQDVPFDPELVFAEMVAALSGEEPHPWHELERGEISLDQYLAISEERAPGASVLFELGSDLNVMRNLEIVDHRMELVAEIKSRGIRVGLVTNNVAEWQPYWLPGLPEGLFEIVIDSADVGWRKPEPQIYSLALDRLGIDDPSRVVFVDDFEWNVTGAIEAGMVGIHCTAQIDLRRALLQTL